MTDEERQAESQEQDEAQAEQEAEEQSAETESGGATYVGQGDYIPGVPARDMTAEEWDALDEELRGIALECGIYEVSN